MFGNGCVCVCTRPRGGSSCGETGPKLNTHARHWKSSGKQLPVVTCAQWPWRKRPLQTKTHCLSHTHTHTHTVLTRLSTWSEPGLGCDTQGKEDEWDPQRKPSVCRAGEREREREGGRAARKNYSTRQSFKSRWHPQTSIYFSLKRREVSELRADGSFAAPPPNTRDNGGESRNTVAALRRPKSAWNCNTQPTAESLSIYIPLFLARATAPWNHHAYSGCACLTLPVGLLGVHACGAGSGAAFKTESGSVINSVFLYERRRAIFFFLHSQRKW